VVAPDLVGHGRSDHRRDDSGYYLWEHAEDMLAVVERLGWSRFHVLAHGMGTGVASILAALTSAIASLQFLDGMGVPFTVAEGDRVEHMARISPQAHAAAQPPAGLCRTRGAVFRQP
jgi:pimeloyl-ACP methyl ester carboxylesterase